MFELLLKIILFSVYFIILNIFKMLLYKNNKLKKDTLPTLLNNQQRTYKMIFFAKLKFI